MNNNTDNYDGLKAYLAGLGRSDPDALDFTAEYENWPTLAVQEIKRRASAVLTGLPDSEVIAIALREVDLRKLAEQVRKEIKKEKRHGNA
ncbi:MAG: hypothetical protein E2593_03215 [Stenotrophomonas sp.]|nr:hypothetical protein [Stenotrophomonas sp.]